MTARQRLLVALVVLGGVGCGPGTIYRWGAYEGLLYDMYKKPGSADPATQVAKLREDVAETASKGQHVPPGVHAHLGYMYYLQGNLAAAEQEFRTERELFPESAGFIDGMLRRMEAL